MEGRLEGKIDILASRPLLSEESSLLSRDAVSEEHTLNLKEISGLSNDLEHRNSLDIFD